MAASAGKGGSVTTITSFSVVEMGVVVAIVGFVVLFVVVGRGVVVVDVVVGSVVVVVVVLLVVEGVV